MVHDSRRSRGVRLGLAREPLAAAASMGVGLDLAERRALHALGPAVFGLDDRALLGVARRRGGDGDTAAHRAAAAGLFEHREQVLDMTAQVLAAVDAPPALRALFALALRDNEMWARMAPCLPAIDFPAACCVELGASLAEARPLSVAGLLYYMGISLIDDVIDDDRAGAWAEVPGEQVTLAGLCLTSHVPVGALTRLWALAPADARMAPYHALFLRASYEMSVGQYLDVRGEVDAGGDPMALSRRIVALKTGSTGAFLAELAATHLGAAAGAYEALGTLCKYLYMSMQVASDIHDIWGKPVSPDLANGVMTLPIVFALHSLPRGERAALQRRLASGDRSEAGQAYMRDRVTAAGGLAYALLEAEALRQRALLAWASGAGALPGQAGFGYLLEAARVAPALYRSRSAPGQDSDAGA
ncbi:polyprenyl synthetase family protein [Haliangium sp.]|uniref:polyprenyl synthetase family protein n=1 Tax=Haliangium sp. TaxID=2663208 RepID=UPI003D1052D2